MSLRDLGAPKSLAALDARYVNETDAAPLALAGQTPSQAPVAPTAAGAIGSEAFTARADHAHPSAGAFAWYGDGFDGDIVLDGTNTFSFLSKSGNTYTAAIRPIFANNLTVAAGVTLIALSNLIFVAGTLTVNGTIQVNGTNASASTGGAALAQAGWIQNGLAGPNGSTGVGTGGTQYGNPPWTFGGNSGAGGTGSSGAGGVGRSGFTAVGVIAGAYYAMLHGSPHFVTGITLYGTNASAIAIAGGISGGAGAGDGTNSGGGAGAGATLMFIFAKTVVVGATGAITANGGNGGTPAAGNCGGGGGGAGGGVYILAVSITNGGTISANGGSGGSGVGTGTAGAAGGAGFVVTRQVA